MRRDIMTAAAAATMRMTMHGIASLHRLFRRSHAKTLESVRHEGDGRRRYEVPP
jgi:hypothetical protein